MPRARPGGEGFTWEESIGTVQRPHRNYQGSSRQILGLLTRPGGWDRDPQEGFQSSSVFGARVNQRSTIHQSHIAPARLSPGRGLSGSTSLDAHTRPASLCGALFDRQTQGKGGASRLYHDLFSTVQCVWSPAEAGRFTRGCRRRQERLPSRLLLHLFWRGRQVQLPVRLSPPQGDGRFGFPIDCSVASSSGDRRSGCPLDCYLPVHRIPPTGMRQCP